jgi:hypothetical protein
MELEVLPQYKGKGIELRLIEWAFAKYGLDERYVWCYADMDKMKAFKSHGWQDVGFVDWNLSEVMGKNRGYGTHRSHLMIKAPRSTSRQAAQVEEPLVDTDKVVA